MALPINPPIKGMTKMPYGLPLMLDAWLRCAITLIAADKVVAEFQSDTGMDINSLVGRTALDVLIDESTGRERKILTRWLDWVTEHFWGEEGKVQAAKAESLIDDASFDADSRPVCESVY